ncbi:hypothetical protein VV089_00145 [Candidatus Merdisoma sp. JLR.KK011]|uniref:hypothetical protein n=1 Tax=Candidatus Merdisoma sp. JLR.KK011 TaxID=3114299 RepID=UPI002FF425EB
MSILNSYDVKVVGVTYDNDDGSSRQEILSRTDRCDPLFIDYFEYCGSPAYSVNNLDGETIGNLPKELSAEIYKKYPDSSLDARVVDILGGDDGLKYGCMIHIDVLSNDNTSGSSDSTPNISDVPIQAKPASGSSNKTYGIIYIILGIILAILGLLVFLVAPVGGLLCIVGGILSIIIGRKYKRKSSGS